MSLEIDIDKNIKSSYELCKLFIKANINNIILYNTNIHNYQYFGCLITLFDIKYNNDGSSFKYITDLDSLITKLTLCLCKLISDEGVNQYRKFKDSYKPNFKITYKTYHEKINEIIVKYKIDNHTLNFIENQQELFVFHVIDLMKKEKYILLRRCIFLIN